MRQVLNDIHLKLREQVPLKPAHKRHHDDIRLGCRTEGDVQRQSQHAPGRYQRHHMECRESVP